MPRRRSTKALELDPDLAEAHTTLAFINLYYDWDWDAAEREFRRAIELNPNYANAHHWYAEYLSLVGRHEAAIRRGGTSPGTGSALQHHQHLGWITVFFRAQVRSGDRAIPERCRTGFQLRAGALGARASL